MFADVLALADREGERDAGEDAEKVSDDVDVAVIDTEAVRDDGGDAVRLIAEERDDDTVPADDDDRCEDGVIEFEGVLDAVGRGVDDVVPVRQLVVVSRADFEDDCVTCLPVVDIRADVVAELEAEELPESELLPEGLLVPRDEEDGGGEREGDPDPDGVLECFALTLADELVFDDCESRADALLVRVPRCTVAVVFKEVVGAADCVLKDERVGSELGVRGDVSVEL